MPRERVHHGELYVDDTAVEPADVTDLHGNPTGARAHALRPFRPGEVLDEGVGVQEMPSLDVTWNREGTVQVAIEAPTDWWEQFYKSLSLEGADRTHYGAYISGLTRHEINHLIRTLRRARDAAFGADE